MSYAEFKGYMLKDAQVTAQDAEVVVPHGKNLTVQIGPCSTILIDKLFGPASFDELRVHIDNERYVWIVEVNRTRWTKETCETCGGKVEDMQCNDCSIVRWEEVTTIPAIVEGPSRG